MIALPISFCVTALLYAAVGFGGGSTYNALLVLAETDYSILPFIALLCNLIVVSGGTWRFACAGYINMRRLVPWVVTSIPAALIGGQIKLSEEFFTGLLGMTLLFAGLRMLWPEKVFTGEESRSSVINTSFALPYVIGALLGLLAGLVGIGGGIFLAPILYMLRWDSPKAIAGICCVFILLNSLAGLTGQMIKLVNTQTLGAIGAYWILFPAVFIGGQLGSHLGAKRLNSQIIRLFTAVLILYVAVRLLWHFGE